MIRRPAGALLAGALTITMVLAGTLRVHADEPPAPEGGANSENFTVYQVEDTPLSSILSGNTDSGGPVLKDVRAVEQGSQTLLVKTWDTPPGYDAEQLVEADFEKGGLHYKQAYVLLVSENYDNQTKLASETVTVPHDKKDDIMAKLQPIMEYNQGGFTGQLTLNADAIVTEAAGQSSYSYAVTDVREFTGLERNDPYNIPKTVDKNGVQLQLVDISWKQYGEGSYTATASYRGTASGTAVSGYISTATYMGEVSKSVLDSVTYAVVYEGSLIPPAPFDFSPYLLAGGGALIALIIVLILLNRRDNTKVYAMIGKEYQLVHKQKLTALAPIVDLSPREISGQSDEFMIVLDRLAARKLRGHSVKIIGKDGMMKEQRIYKVRTFHIGHRLEEEQDYEYQG